MTTPAALPSIRPCPFCGRADSTHTADCYFMVDEEGGDVIAAWNRRAALEAEQSGPQAHADPLAAAWERHKAALADLESLIRQRIEKEKS